MKTTRYGIDDKPIFVIDPSRCIGCEACVQACAECGTHRGQSLIHLERIDRAVSTQTAPMVCMHCEDPTCAQVCPADAIKQTEEGIVQSAPQAPLHRLLELRDRLPVRRPQVRRRVRPDDEVRHVHRPHLGGLRPDVRVGVPERSPLVRHARGVPRHPPAAPSSTTGCSAARAVHTKVFTVVDDLGPIDALDGTTGTWLDDPFGLED